MTKAAQAPLHMEHTREGSAAVIDATGRLIAVMQTVDARLFVEAVNNRDLAERAIYRQKVPPTIFDWPTEWKRSDLDLL
jgi:hypothetical protein